MSRLVIVSNRVADPGKAAAGGLAVAVKESLQQTGGLWFGWSGKIREETPGGADRGLLDAVEGVADGGPSVAMSGAGEKQGGVEFREATTEASIRRRMRTLRKQRQHVQVRSRSHRHFLRIFSPAALLDRFPVKPAP